MRIQLMYLGERVNVFGVISQLFRDKRGRAVNFTGVKWVYFGSIYEAERTGDNVSIKRKPKEIDRDDWKPTEEDSLEYERHKILAVSVRQNRLKAMKLKRPHEDIQKAVQLIRRFYIGMTNVDRRRFIQWFANECSKKEKKK